MKQTDDQDDFCHCRYKHLSFEVEAWPAEVLFYHSEDLLIGV